MLVQPWSCQGRILNVFIDRNQETVRRYIRVTRNERKGLALQSTNEQCCELAEQLKTCSSYLSYFTLLWIHNWLILQKFNVKNL